MKKRIISLLLTFIMIASAVIPSVSAFCGSCAYEEPFTVTKISNPDSGEREVDGLIEGGESFEIITRDSFGDKYNYGCPAFLETEEGLYIGTCNPFYGGQLYLLTNNKSEPEPPETFTLSGKAVSYKTNVSRSLFGL